MLDKRLDNKTGLGRPCWWQDDCTDRSRAYECWVTNTKSDHRNPKRLTIGCKDASGHEVGRKVVYRRTSGWCGGRPG